MWVAAPRYSARLPGSLWGIATYYNPARYANKLVNFRTFATRVRAQGLGLMAVELAFGDAPFELKPEDGDRLIQLRTAAVLWQKERLLNIGLTCLPRECDKVAWLDADVIFENDRWVAQTSELLEAYVVVQPFHTACRLPRGETWRPQDEFAFGDDEGQAMPGMAYVMSNTHGRRTGPPHYDRHGHTGLAWTARRSLLERHGFYDYHVLGGGDHVMAHAMYGIQEADIECLGTYRTGARLRHVRMPGALLEAVLAWGGAFHADVRGSVFYTEGRTLHLWHGRREFRQYGHRLEVMTANAFDPRGDLVKDPNACWAWNSNKPQLHDWARQYFYFRREDGVIPVTPWFSSSFSPPPLTDREC